MALNTCPDCSLPVSDLAPACPRCGRPSPATLAARALRRRLAKRLGALAAIVTGAVALQQVRHAHALGTPTITPLAYSGSLLTFGQPDNANHTVVLALFVSGANDGGLGSAACTTTAVITCVNGQFSIPLSASCVTVVQSNPNIEAEVTVDSVSMGMTNVSAVPYAIEAGTAATVAAANVTGVLAVAGGGTGSSTQNFVAQDSATGEASLPAGTTGQRTSSPANGMIRYNTTTGGLETYASGGWIAVGTASCPTGMVASGLGFCIDPSPSSESSYASSFPSCAARGALPCRYEQLFGASQTGAISSVPAVTRVSDFIFYTGDDTTYFGTTYPSQGNVNWLHQPPGTPFPYVLPNGGGASYYCCR